MLTLALVVCVLTLACLYVLTLSLVVCVDIGFVCVACPCLWLCALTLSLVVCVLTLALIVC